MIRYGNTNKVCKVITDRYREYFSKKVIKKNMRIWKLRIKWLLAVWGHLRQISDWRKATMEKQGSKKILKQVLNLFGSQCRLNDETKITTKLRNWMTTELQELMDIITECDYLQYSYNKHRILYICCYRLGQKTYFET